MLFVSINTQPHISYQMSSFDLWQCSDCCRKRVTNSHIAKTTSWWKYHVCELWMFEWLLKHHITFLMLFCEMFQINPKSWNTSYDFRFWFESHFQELGSIIVEKKADDAPLHWTQRDIWGARWSGGVDIDDGRHGRVGRLAGGRVVQVAGQLGGRVGRGRGGGVHGHNTGAAGRLHGCSSFLNIFSTGLSHSKILKCQLWWLRIFLLIQITTLSLPPHPQVCICGSCTPLREKTFLQDSFLPSCGQ